MHRIFATAGLSVALLAFTGATAPAVGGQAGGPARTVVHATVLASGPDCPDPSVGQQGCIDSLDGCCSKPTS